MLLFPRLFCPHRLAVLGSLAFIRAEFAAAELAEFTVEEESVDRVTGIVWHWSELWRSHFEPSPLMYSSWISGISTAEIEMFIRLAAVFTPQRILIIGGGAITLILSSIFAGASVDVLDTGMWPNLGDRLARFYAEAAQKDIAISNGYTAKDIRLALRSKNESLGQPYQLVVLTGPIGAQSAGRRFFADFVGIYAHLAESAVVVGQNSHWRLQRSLCSILCKFIDMRFVFYKTIHYPEQAQISGTGFMYRGFPDDAFAGLHDFKIPYQCGKPHYPLLPVVYMVRKLMHNGGAKVRISLPRRTSATSEILENSVIDVEDTVLQWYFEVTGLRVLKDKGKQMRLGTLMTGFTITRSDIELFIRLRSIITPERIFIVGNAWGYSTLVLSHIFTGSSLDVIDAGVEGDDNLQGIEITRSVAAWAKKDISVLLGFSPKDTPRALRWEDKQYELVFIDGKHTKQQVFEDFAGIYPYLAEKAIVVFHDVGFTLEVKAGVCTILCTFPEMRFVSYGSVHFPELARFTGTGFMYRGFGDDQFAAFHLDHAMGANLEYGTPKTDVIWMLPKLQPSCPSDIL